MLGWRKISIHLIAALGITFCALLLPKCVYAEQLDSMLPERSKEEIIDHWRLWNTGTSGTSPAFAEEPATTAPYLPGKLNDEYLKRGLDTANFYRFITGLPSDLQLDPQLNRQAQHGSVLVSTVGQLTHWPKQPADMLKEFYDIGYKSSSSSNLYYTSGSNGNILVDSVNAYIDDSDVSNIDRLGHRRWVLSPQLKNIGFGLAYKSNPAKGSGYYSAMQVFDTSRSDSLNFNYSLYPNKGYFPLEYFNGQQAWSVQLNPERFEAPSLSDVKVELTRLSDQRTWNFNHEMVKEEFPAGYRNVDSEDLKWQQQAYFNVDTTKYGHVYAIIFRPDDVQMIQDGEQFSVNITGLRKIDGTPAEISYQTHFFKIDPSRTNELQNLSTQTKEISIKQNGQAELPTVIASYSNGLRFTVESNYKLTTSSDLIQINGNIIKGIKPGRAELLFEYEGQQLKLTVNISGRSNFSDVDSHWASSAIAWAIDREIASGYKDGTFKPNNPITEAEFFAMLFKLYSNSSMVQSMKKSAGTAYYDRGAWSDEYYRFAGTLNLDVDDSIKDIKLRNQPITRLQVARIVAGLGGRNYSDDDSIRYLFNMGYTSGKTSATVEGYAGDDKLTRAEAIVFLKNLYELGYDIWPKPLSPTPFSENEKNGGFPDNTVRAIYSLDHSLFIKGTFPEVAGKTFSVHINGPSPLSKRLMTRSVTADDYGNFSLTITGLEEPSLSIDIETRENFMYWLKVEAGNATVNAYQN